jgi:hypothetical protein
MLLKKNADYADPVHHMCACLAGVMLPSVALSVVWCGETKTRMVWGGVGWGAKEQIILSTGCCTDTSAAGGVQLAGCSSMLAFISRARREHHTATPDTTALDDSKLHVLGSLNEMPTTLSVLMFLIDAGSTSGVLVWCVSEHTRMSAMYAGDMRWSRWQELAGKCDSRMSALTMRMSACGMWKLAGGCGLGAGDYVVMLCLSMHVAWFRVCAGHFINHVDAVLSWPCSV